VHDVAKQHIALHDRGCWPNTPRTGSTLLLNNHIYSRRRNGRRHLPQPRLKMVYMFQYAVTHGADEPSSRPQINVVQCQNLSWFGYPDDTVPSVRASLLPGFTKVWSAQFRHHTPSPWPAISR